MKYSIRKLLEKMNSTGIGCILNLTFYCNVPFSTLNKLFYSEDHKDSDEIIKGNEYKTVDFQFSDGENYLGKISWKIDNFVGSSTDAVFGQTCIRKISEKKLGATNIDLFNLEIEDLVIDGVHLCLYMDEDANTSDGSESYGRMSIRLFCPKDGIKGLEKLLESSPAAGIFIK